jgi:serine/threonine protein kinase
MPEQESVFNREIPAEPSSISLPPDLPAVGNTQLVSLISNHSAESDVWLGEQPDGKQVAVKIYRHGRIPGLVDPTQKCALSHPNLVPVLEAGEVQGRYFEISPFVPGGTLADLIQRRGRLTEAEVEIILDQLSEVIHYLHSRHVLHRDIKPTNVFIVRESPFQVALADFGTARLGAYQTILTGTVGTVAYSSPEAVTGIQSEAADYWGLGTVLLEALTGRRPLEGLDVKQQLYRVASGKIEIPEAIPARWKELLGGLLRSDYTERWRKQEIEQWLRSREAIPIERGQLKPAAKADLSLADRTRSRLPVDQRETLIHRRSSLMRAPETVTLTVSDIGRLVLSRATTIFARFFWLALMAFWFGHRFWIAFGLLVVLAIIGTAIDFLPHKLERLKRETRVGRQLTDYSRDDQQFLRLLVRDWMRAVRHGERHPSRTRTRIRGRRGRNRNRRMVSSV